MFLWKDKSSQAYILLALCMRCKPVFLSILVELYFLSVLHRACDVIKLGKLNVPVGAIVQPGLQLMVLVLNMGCS